jgi:hypothetical protein
VDACAGAPAASTRASEAKLSDKLAVSPRALKRSSCPCAWEVTLASPFTGSLRCLHPRLWYIAFDGAGRGVDLDWPPETVVALNRFATDQY